MIPSPGRIVQYTLSEQDAEQINKRREDSRKSGIAGQNSGAVVHVGNVASAGNTLPMMIVRVWGSGENAGVNGQVFLDGNDTFWATSTTQGEGERHWREFPHVRVQ